MRVYCTVADPGGRGGEVTPRQKVHVVTHVDFELKK